MASTAAELQRILEDLRGAVGAVTPQAVLDVVAAKLAERFPIGRASIRLVVPDAAALEVVAVWSSDETLLGIGTRMSLGSTSYASVAATGRAERRVRVHAGDGLLDEIMTMDGINSYVTLPLRAGSRTMGLFSVSSREVAAFSESDLPCLEEIAELVCLAVTEPA